MTFSVLTACMTKGENLRKICDLQMRELDMKSKNRTWVSGSCLLVVILILMPPAAKAQARGSRESEIQPSARNWRTGYELGFSVGVKDNGESIVGGQSPFIVPAISFWINLGPTLVHLRSGNSGGFSV